MRQGNAGTTTFTFTVSLSAPAPAGGVTFDIATADGTATAPSDYTAKSLTSQTIPAGSSTYTFDVLVNGDTTPELDKLFLSMYQQHRNAIGTDTQGGAPSSMTTSPKSTMSGQQGRRRQWSVRRSRSKALSSATIRAPRNCVDSSR